MYARILSFALLFAALALPQGGPAPLPAQQPPAPPAGVPRAGQPLPGLSAAELASFNEGLSRFQALDSVSGTQPGAPDSGLGPRFNLNGCAGCHAQPAIGGSSPQVNPQIAVATNYGATNKIPDFIQQSGPVRVARFVQKADGTPDGGVHNLFVISGRSDAPGCNIAQPDFATAEAQKNVVFRIPVPLYGAGLMEAIPDTAILNNKAANAQLKAQLGIAGHENRNVNDGTITRFGWKAQNKSLLLFAGEAYNVEQGVTNDLFPTERDETPACGFNTTPEDQTSASANSLLTGISDITAFGVFMRYLAQPVPAPDNPSIANGRQLFSQIGCATCHTPVLTTGNASSPALRNQQVHLFSDLLVHDMGAGLADGISQGNAAGNEFRTPPLWGLGARLFFLHDGRTADLGQSIAAHQSAGSEANQVISAYDALASAAREDLLTFLRAL